MAIASPVVGAAAIIPSTSPSNYSVTPTGTPQALPSAVCYEVSFHAEKENTGDVRVGGSDLSLSNGVQLGPGDSYTYSIDNASKLRYVSSVPNQTLLVEVKSL